jgi:aminoglycoside 2''-phosphotransferase
LRELSPDPGSDRHLGEATVAVIVRSQFGLNASTVERLGEGWDNEVFVVDEDWIFRFPKRANAIWLMEREIAIMPVIERSIGVPVPRFEMLGHAGEGFAYPFVGYRRIKGLPADRVEQGTSLDGLAADVGRALTNLHSIDPAHMPPKPTEPWELEDLRSQLAEEGARVAPFVPEPVARKVEPYLRGEVEPPPDFEGAGRFLHADINPDHVIVDPKSGQLAGIIDFGDAEVSDPVGDFVGLVSIGGMAFARHVREHYALECDNGFDERLRWSARVLNLHWLASAVIDGRDYIERRQGWVLRAFES